MFQFDSFSLRGEFVSVRVWADEGAEPPVNCGVLTFTLDKWFAFHALMAGKPVDEVRFKYFDEVRAVLAPIESLVESYYPSLERLRGTQREDGTYEILP